MTITNAGTLSGADWFKSSYSDNQGGNCVEGARLCAEAVRSMDWFKSSYSNNQGGACVEGARFADGTLMAVRDSKVPDGPALLFAQSAFSSFIAAVQQRQFEES